MEKTKETTEVLKQLDGLLQGGNAHKSLADAVDGLPAELRGVVPEKLPYSIWQLVWHIRLAQWDILQFSKDGNHSSPKWPDGYWTKEKAPRDDKEWDNALAQIEADTAEFLELLKKEDIYKPLPHGDGQSLLREALLIGDHTAYHTAEIILIRRLLGA